MWWWNWTNKKVWRTPWNRKTLEEFFPRDDVIIYGHFLHFCGESTGNWRIPKRSNNAHLWCFLGVGMNKLLNKHSMLGWFETLAQENLYKPQMSGEIIVDLAGDRTHYLQTEATSLDEAGKIWQPFCTHFHINCLTCKLLYSNWNFTTICSQGPFNNKVVLGSNNGSTSTRRQASIWLNAGKVYWGIYASLDLDELTCYGTLEVPRDLVRSRRPFWVPSDQRKQLQGRF